MATKREVGEQRKTDRQTESKRQTDSRQRNIERGCGERVNK